MMNISKLKKVWALNDNNNNNNKKQWGPKRSPEEPHMEKFVLKKGKKLPVLLQCYLAFREIKHFFISFSLFIS